MGIAAIRRQRLVVRRMEHLVNQPEMGTMALLNGSTAAAVVMAERRLHLSNRKRPYTGAVDGRRRRKFSLLVLPNGHVGELLGAIRGRVFFRWRDDREIDPVHVGWAWEECVSYFPLPAAQALGKLKAGVKERSSARKAAACRRNGLRPCRPGRRRGRPRQRA